MYIAERSFENVKTMNQSFLAKKKVKAFNVKVTEVLSSQLSEQNNKQFRNGKSKPAIYFKYKIGTTSLKIKISTVVFPFHY